MSGSVSSSDRGEQGKTLRRLELQRIKAGAQAKAAQYHAMAIELEARLGQENSSPPPDAAARNTRTASPAATRKQRRERDSLSSLLDNTSSWLTSAVVHLVIILVLGVLTLKMVEESSPAELMATIDAEEDAELAEVELGDVDEIELDQLQALDFKLEDPGLAKLGETTSALEDVSQAGSIGLAETTGEIGALFGRDGKGWASAGGGTGGGTGGGATFFGVNAGGNRFVFVVDSSASMRRNGWAACRYELVAAVRRLKPHQFFYVILFNNQPHRMFSDSHPEPRPVRATPENIVKLDRWVRSFQLGYGTLPKESMKLALTMRPDAIYFLTDGQIQDDTEGFLKQKNKRKDAYDNQVRAATVQTIGFYSDRGRAVLQRIAEQNGGAFRYVTRPRGDLPNRGRRGKR